MNVKKSGQSSKKNECQGNSWRKQLKQLLYLHPCQLGWSPVPIPVTCGGFPGRKRTVVTFRLNK